MFYLETPSKIREEEAKQFLYEFVNNDSEVNFVGGLEKILKGVSYDDWLYLVTKLKDKEYASSIKEEPAYTYFLIREDDNKIVGMLKLNYADDIGNISYSIRPTERRKGYSKINIFLGLLVAQTIGLNKVSLGCKGIACAKNINDFSAEGNVIDVEKAIEDNKDIYSKYLSEKEVR